MESPIDADRFYCPYCKIKPALAFIVQTGTQWHHKACGQWLEVSEAKVKGGQDEPIPVVPITFDVAVWSILKELHAILVKKQSDYGPGNISDFGEHGVLIRVNDKIARLKNLTAHEGHPNIQNESINDTWIDLANYGVIALMIRRGLWGLPLAK